LIQKNKSKLKIFILLSTITGFTAGIFGFLLRKRKKRILYKGEERLLYPQDILLDKTLLRLIPYFIKPTHITVLRILLTPFIAFLILQIENLPIVIFAFLAVSFTDMIDGAMARTRGQITDLGKALDPVADKLLFISCAGLLMPKYDSLYLFLAIVFLEILTMATSGFIMKSKKDIGANIFGKIKLNLQLLGLLMFIILDHAEKKFFFISGNIILILSLLFGITSYIVTLISKDKKDVNRL
jgi:CDP-diacylglycerol--glycerol-3-phosphate 3-phosphatidyltransferase